jgi:hypothetical protein
MLKRFSSNTRKLNRVLKQINLNNLSGSGYLDNLLEDYQLQSSLSASFDGRDENGDPLSEEQAILELSASIAYNYNTSFDTRISTKFNSNTKSNPNPTKLVNNKNKITEFHNEILQFGARQNSRPIDEFDNINNTLTILNVTTDYGTEGASPENFEVLVFGLHIPGDYTIENVGNNVVVTLNDEYIDFDNVTINDIYVIGKLVDIPIAAENDIILSTENGLDLIV